MLFSRLDDKRYLHLHTFHFTDIISIDTHDDVRINMHIVPMRSKHKASDLLLMPLAVLDEAGIKPTQKA